jgi:hypothetical protein
LYNINNPNRPVAITPPWRLLHPFFDHPLYGVLRISHG